MISTDSFSTFMTIGHLVGDHLWQSTLFAAFVGLLTLAFRKNRAQVRNGLWLAASVKFLVPFVALLAIGSHFGWHPAALHLQSSASVVMQPWAPMSEPFEHLAPQAPLSVASLNLAALVPMALLGIWLFGCAAILLTWWRGWRRVATDVRAASPVSRGPELDALRRLEAVAGIVKPVVLVSSETSLEPGVFGITTPVLLWPRSLTGHLTNAHIEMILAHELSHVRRRDNLAAAVHMVVETLFWFHPLVWWLGARMVDERERACDEDVLHMGGEPQIYAESVLKVCEFYLESPLACMAGVTGSNLKKRMERIMSNRVGRALTGWRKLVLAAAGVAALLVPLIVGVLTAPPRLLAQSAGAPTWQAAAGGKMSFDVASVKRNPAPGRPTANVYLVGDAYAATGGLFSVTNTPLMNYMRFAFKDMKVIYQEAPDGGAPAWVRGTRYDIEAKAQGNPTKDQMRLMVQSLLADRFKLTFHYETRHLPVYALVLSKEGKLGPQLKPDSGSCSTTAEDVQAIAAAPQLPPPAPPASTSQTVPFPCGFLTPAPASAAGLIRVAGSKVTMALLAEMLPNPVTGIDRSVFDHTGLTGTFDVSFEWAPRLPPGAPPPPGFTPDTDGPTFTEGLQSGLGLKLVPQTGPVDVLVVDHVEEPSPN